MTEWPRTILHADMDAFYAAVEQRDHPEWRGKPVIVGGTSKRGVVATASYEARAFGVHSAQPGTIARRLCPDGIFVAPRMDVYVAVSQRIQAIFADFTPEVEALSLDEAFLDVSASRLVFGDGPAIAQRIRERVRAETGLTISIGVASSKFVAKVASDLDKPDGPVVVAPGDERAFLRPLPAQRLWGAGKRTQALLGAHGIRTIGDVQDLGQASLRSIVGEHAASHFAQLAVGEHVGFAFVQELDVAAQGQR
ncbi:MAG TPA: DNA polymerase IV, partial [Planctomycetota bacterium]|nr:DNA polymerase IV [Planctomycetota bacterium]